jgi:hypothetical protein
MGGEQSMCACTNDRKTVRDVHLDSGGSMAVKGTPLNVSMGFPSEDAPTPERRKSKVTFSEPLEKPFSLDASESPPKPEPAVIGEPQLAVKLGDTPPREATAWQDGDASPAAPKAPTVPEETGQQKQETETETDQKQRGPANAPDQRSVTVEEVIRMTASPPLGPEEMKGETVSRPVETPPPPCDDEQLIEKVVMSSVEQKTRIDDSPLLLPTQLDADLESPPSPPALASRSAKRNAKKRKQAADNKKQGLKPTPDSPNEARKLAERKFHEHEVLSLSPWGEGVTVQLSVWMQCLSPPGPSPSGSSRLRI